MVNEHVSPRYTTVSVKVSFRASAIATGARTHAESSKELEQDVSSLSDASRQTAPSDVTSLSLVGKMRLSGAARRTLFTAAQPTDAIKNICTNKHAAPCRSPASSSCRRRGQETAKKR